MRQMFWAVVLGVFVPAHGCAPDETASFAEPSAARAKDAAGKVNGDALKAHVFNLVAERVKEVPVKSPFSIKEPMTHINSRDYVANELQKLGYVPTLETSDNDGLTLSNVYVELPGRSPELVVVSGHHDAWFQSGADDNASAVAVLLEAARVLKGGTYNRTIRIIAFDREEEGLLGATRHAAAHASDNIRVVLNMDTVGYASREPGSQDAPPGLALRDKGDFLAVIANDIGRQDAYRVVRLSNSLPLPVDMLGLVAPGDGFTAATGAFLRSDHTPYWKAGVRALFLTDTAEFRNHNYHTPEDTPEKLDYDFLRRVAELVIGSVAAFAEGD